MIKPSSDTFPSDPSLDYYNLYHQLRRKLVGLQEANTRCHKLLADQSARLERVLNAYAELEEKLR